MMVERIRKGLETEERDYTLAVAASWAQLGDPDSVPAMIAMLDDRARLRYAAAALSWTFGMAGVDDDHTRSGTLTHILVPSRDGRLEKTPLAAAPKGTDLKRSWEEFWSRNKDDYRWSEDTSLLQRAVAKEK
jgi:hypothetical protein